MNSVADAQSSKNMDDKKLRNSSNDYYSKNTEILDEKLNRVSGRLSTIENNIRAEINQIKEGINSVICSNQLNKS